MTNSRKSQSEKLATGGGRETTAVKPDNKLGPRPAPLAESAVPKAPAPARARPCSRRAVSPCAPPLPIGASSRSPHRVRRLRLRAPLHDRHDPRPARARLAALGCVLAHLSRDAACPI
jgi:hypothetical protein